ncbi:nucleotide exchange factor GrpE [Candidatus Dojkabacteria bacterium]|uniref:Protein GrpE n=1 Tax=Candidatus Dojkabacteria bacterium TaxID=2099670 RepID=A0A3M0Z428_9BACT|nr:MAG: nucleotide exchange factor GrpE [Candidatus Dojkabacteria bacterium]
MNIFERINDLIKTSNDILKKKGIVAKRKLINLSFKKKEDISKAIDLLSERATYVGENDEKITFSVDKGYLQDEHEAQLISINKTSTETEDVCEVIYWSENEYEEFSSDGIVFKFMSHELEVNPDKKQETKGENKDANRQPEEETEIEKLRKQYESERNARIELMADFQNFRKRVEEERALFGAMSNMALIGDIIEVYDDINMALNDLNLDLEQAKNSLMSAQDKLMAAIKKSGVVRVQISVGDDFNRETMEAISTVDSGEEMRGKVVAVISSAIKYENKEGVIKHAKVIVGK